MIFTRKKNIYIDFIVTIFLESLKRFRNISMQRHPKAVRLNEWTYRTVIYPSDYPKG